MQDAILVLSRNGSLAGLIARILRGRQIYCTILPLRTPYAKIAREEIKGVIVADDGDPSAFEEMDAELWQGKTPTLLLGEAAGYLCARLGGRRSVVEGNPPLSLSDDPLFLEMSGEERVLHALSALELPPALIPIASAEDKPVGYKHASLPLYGMQYPIECNDPDGARMLANFALEICRCRDGWDDDAMIDQALNAIRAHASAHGRVLCAVSGGVDSALCAKLASIAVGNRLTCVFIDTGCFHQDEPERVIHSFMESMGIVVAYVDAKEQFLRSLEGISSPKAKERIASSVLTQVLLRQFSYEPDIHTLVMGTNFNDALYGFSPTAEIDSAKGALELTVLEPIGNLFKNEVRRLARALHLPECIASRQPFPAGGLALRVFGEVTEERLGLLRQTDALLTEEIAKSGYGKKLWQYYTILLPSPDKPERYTVSIRALQAGSFTATAARLPFDLVERITARILREVPIVSRVVYDFTPSRHYGELE